MKSLRERDGNLINQWYILCLSSELGTKAIERTVYEWPYVAFRSAENEPRVFINRCPHQGAKLSEGRCERTEKAVTLRCPYHGWTFDSEGDVIEIPSEDVTKKRHALTPIPVREQDGVIWVWMGEARKMTDSPSWRFPRSKDPAWAGYFMVTDFDNEVTALIQNFMDVPHTVYVHDKWFRKQRRLKVPITIEAATSRVKVTYQQPDDKIGFMETILNPKREPVIHTDEFIFPNITQVDYFFGERGFTINSQCTPTERYKTRVYTWITYKLGLPTPWLRPFLKFYTTKVIQQDVAIMKNQGDNLKRFEKFAIPGNFTASNADEMHVAIDRLRTLGTKESADQRDVTFHRTRDIWI